MQPTSSDYILCRIFGKEDVPTLLKVWGQEGRFSLVTLGELRLNGVLFLLAAPAGYSVCSAALTLFKKLKGA